MPDFAFSGKTKRTMQMWEMILNEPAADRFLTDLLPCIHRRNVSCVNDMFASS
jgi:hypothetical protein